MPPETPKPPRDRDYLFDIVDAMRHALRYVEGMDEPGFAADEKTQDAVLRRLTIIGEATKRLSPAWTAKHAQVPWKKMAGMRDVVVHDYDGIDLAIVWAVVAQEIPALLPTLEAILAAEQTNSEGEVK